MDLDPALADSLAELCEMTPGPDLDPEWEPLTHLPRSLTSAVNGEARLAVGVGPRISPPTKFLKLT